MAVLNELKPGLDEKLYEKALIEELRYLGIDTNQQMQFPVYYRGKKIGLLIPDLIADGKIIVDTKVVTTFNDSHVAQMIGYLNITGLQIGYLINFQYRKLQWRRIIRESSSEVEN